MNYAKPRVVRVDTATQLIQGCPPGSKLGFILGEIDVPLCGVTVAAYEADE